MLKIMLTATMLTLQAIVLLMAGMPSSSFALETAPNAESIAPAAVVIPASPVAAKPLAPPAAETQPQSMLGKAMDSVTTALKRAIHDDNPGVRAAAAKGLGVTKPPQPGALKGKTPPALAVSAKVPPAKADDAMFRALAFDKNASVRLAAAQSLNPQDPRALRLLARGLNDANREVRRACIDGLRKAGKAAIPVLTHAAEHRRGLVRLQAIKLLAELRQAKQSAKVAGEKISPAPAIKKSAAAKVAART